jgi:hypothetical protein
MMLGLKPTSAQVNKADIACRATASLSPQVTGRQCRVRHIRCLAGPAPDNRTRHGECHRVIASIVRGLRSGLFDWSISISSYGLSIPPERMRNRAGQEARSIGPSLDGNVGVRSRGSCRQHADAAGQIRRLNADPQAAIIPEPDPVLDDRTRRSGPQRAALPEFCTPPP